MRHNPVHVSRFFFATAPLPCPYLPDRVERRIVTELVIEPLDPRDLHDIIDVPSAANVLVSIRQRISDRFRQPGIHHAELLPHRFADRVQLAGVIPDGDDKGSQEQSRNQEQTGVNGGDKNDGGDDAQEAGNDEHDAGAEPDVEGSHIVGGAGHDVADALLAVKGLAFAQQTDVKFITSISLHALGDEFVGVIAD